jgi:hypothetical protein
MSRAWVAAAEVSCAFSSTGANPRAARSVLMESRIRN